MSRADSPPPLGSVRHGEVVGYVNEKLMIQGFVRAFAEACATGVPVELRKNLRAYRMDGSTQVIDQRLIAHERLTRELRSTRQRLSNAMTAAENASTSIVLAAMTKKADELAEHVGGLELQLYELAQLPEEPHPPTFKAATDVLLAALANVVTTSRVSLEEHAAFRVIVPSIRLDRADDGTWHAEAHVRLPVTDGVAELGPVRWPVAAPGIGQASMRAARPAALSAVRDGPPAALRRPLEVDAGLHPNAARLLTRAPFPELAHLVLSARTSYEPPAWIDEQWRDPGFIAHLVAVYGVAPEKWAGPTLYGRRMPRAQAVVDCAADAGRLTLAGYREVMPGVDANEMWIFARPQTVGGRVRGAVVDKHIDASGTWGLVNRRCQCGRPALVVAHAPEIPGSLLCECGLAVDAPEASTAVGVRFPAPYIGLRVARTHWMHDLRRTNGSRDDELSEVSLRQEQILRVMLSEPARAWLCTELAEQAAMSPQTCQWNLTQLHRRRFVDRDGRPAQHVLVDALDTERALARSWRRRPSP